MNGGGKKRVFRVLGIHPEYIDRYKQMHANPWSQVSQAIKRIGIRNYSIFIHGNLIFSYYEIPEDIDQDFIAQQWVNDPVCQQWERIMQQMQIPVPDAAKGEWWSQAEEIFHQE